MKSLLAVLVFLAAAPSFAGNKYECVGTEPYWKAKVQDDLILADDANDGPQILSVSNRIYPLGTADSFGEVVKAQGAKYDAVLTIRADAKCNDGQSDDAYSHEVWFLKGNKLVVGCCNIAK
ncbi:MAG TPA: hypothetical protein VN132_05700 [Bdellovibrio sp.]|nr:hypothetical protein [Bdellovibrio sp.]